MTIRSLGETVPRIAQTVWVSEAAYVVGDVEIGEDPGCDQVQSSEMTSRRSASTEMR